MADVAADALPSIEPLETRAMMAALGPESWTTAPFGSGAITSSGPLLACSSPTPSSAGTSSLAPQALGIGVAAAGVVTNGPVLSEQPIGGVGVQSTGPCVGVTTRILRSGGLVHWDTPNTSPDLMLYLAHFPKRVCVILGAD